jgi:hypothetical protein
VIYASYGPCHWCKRDTDALSVNVALETGEIVVCCDGCWSKRDEDYLDERLDMTDD